MGAINSNHLILRKPIKTPVKSTLMVTWKKNTYDDWWDCFSCKLHQHQQRGEKLHILSHLIYSKWELLWDVFTPTFLQASIQIVVVNLYHVSEPLYYHKSMVPHYCTFYQTFVIVTIMIIVTSHVCLKRGKLLSQLYSCNLRYHLFYMFFACSITSTM